jgi:hypothetical protein
MDLFQYQLYYTLTWNDDEVYIPDQPRSLIFIVLADWINNTQVDLSL